MRFVAVEATNTDLIQKFLARAGSSLDTFRYFAARPLEVLGNHVCTWVIEDRGDVVAYGHLDREGDTVWLGIAVACDARGKGLGHRMMRRLIESADDVGVSEIRLSVDNSNCTAIRLYERFGFQLLTQGEMRSLYEWRKGSLHCAEAFE